LIGLVQQETTPVRWPAGADTLQTLERKANGLLEPRVEAFIFRDCSS
jgi:hypothetical protein